MFSKTKIAAFTMMDVLTGMVVMSIVVVMVFYLLSATSGQAAHYQSVRIQLNDYLLMRATLKREVVDAARMEKVPGGFCLKQESTSVSYLQHGDRLVRKTGTSIDTLFTGIEQMVLTPVGSSLLGQGTELISAVMLQLNYHEQRLTCHLYKDYGITEPINQLLYREP